MILHWLGVFLLVSSAPLWAEGNDEAKNDQTVVVPKNAKAADVAAKTTEMGSILRLVNEALKERPEGSKARVILRSIFSNHPDHYGVQAYPYAVVPLNDKGEPDGIETVIGIGAGGDGLMRIVPWKDGKRSGEEKIYEHGRIKTVVPWVDGKIHGLRKTFHPEGAVMVEAAYENGQANGPTRNYDEKGRLTHEANMKNGKRHGFVRDFWPDTGKVKREIQYEMGTVVGVTKEYYASGQLKREVPFKNNSMHGVEVNYEADGSLARERHWLNGEPVTEADFNKMNEK